MKILVIEDEQRVAAAIKRSLEANGFSVDIKADSKAGLKAAQDSVYALIVLDRMLPGPYDGLEIVVQLRDGGSSTPILMLTALGEVENKVEGLQVGADDYLVKPFSIRELLARINVLLKRPKQNIGNVLYLADLEFNIATHEVTRDSKVINLNKRELKLFTYFMYNKGQIISKDKLISHVWDGDTLIMSNTIEVYVGYLRKKIDKNFPSKPPLIHTVYGFGYRMGED